MKLKVCLAGVTGWIGRPLAVAISATDDLDLVAAVARRPGGDSVAGVTVSGSVKEALLTPCDVFVDYTSAAAVKANVLAAVAARRHVVIGSSGLAEHDFAEIDAAARAQSVGVMAAGNFAVSAALLQRFAAEAARHFPAWEMVDYAHDSKVDAPSGTARELAWRLSQVGQPKPAVALSNTLGPRESRGATVSGVQVHSLRLPGHTIALEVHFGRDDERLTIGYEGGSGATPYIAGTLLAIRRVPTLVGVTRGLDSIL